MEEEEKETSGKAILCLKVHLLCYFFYLFWFIVGVEEYLSFGKCFPS